jgi:hypothetical protein
MTEPPRPSRDPADAFSREAERPRPSFLTDFAGFLRHNKKWWITPIVVMLLLVSVLVILGGTGVAPFIYTLF